MKTTRTFESESRLYKRQIRLTEVLKEQYWKYMDKEQKNFLEECIGKLEEGQMLSDSDIAELTGDDDEWEAIMRGE